MDTEFGLDVAPVVTTRRVAPLRVLFMSHMHPKASRGGAEIAAYQLYQTVKSLPRTEAYFLAAGGGRFQERLGARIQQPFGPDEFIYTGAGFDHWIQSNPDPEFPAALTALLHKLRPDVVHLHHYANFGVETLLYIRRALPDVKIVLTLHEFLAICNHFGQMVKRPSFSLCYQAGLRDCAKCFPERSEQDFFLRIRYMHRFFNLVDHFISPSQFLADRYIEWGLDGRRFSIVENGMPEQRHHAVDETMPSQENGLIFAFFGQISRLKGIDVLFDAAALLEKAKVSGFRIEVHGDYSAQPPELRAAFEQRLEEIPENLRFCGAYENARVHQLMRSAHAIMVPSIWWENSPLVIQEALLNRRPVITSDIGGMAEKVRDGLDGFHFQAGSAHSLAALIKRLAEMPETLLNLQRSMAVPPSLRETTRATTRLYRKLIQARDAQPLYSEISL
ncbi:glycosyltransferase [Belnapia rosea]|uniref:glycosyltransferase n=1 Tax=Belnapia rosea TaxID=938405 RepID=UPI000890B2FF|nr:glycosyltransferase [Belnapia rosea]SDB74759.1 Glycosyltransferase involved in cell wall bisynthesis [Belnapia rosea]